MPTVYDLAWSVVFLLGPLLVVLGATAAVTLALLDGAARRRAAEASSPLAAAATLGAQARATTTHVTAWVLALLATLVLLTLGGVALPRPVTVPRFADHVPGADYWATSWNPVPLALAPAGIAFVYLAVLLVGEATWRSADGTVRRAGLMARSTHEIAPAILRRALWVWTALLVAAALLGGLTATGTGTLVRSVAAPRSGYADLVQLVVANPYPSWKAGVPLALGALAVLLGVELLLRRVTDRPAIDGVDPTWDLALRRLTARRALRLPQLVAGVTLGVVLIWLGKALLTVELPAAGWTLVVLGSSSALVAVALSTLPGRPLPRSTAETATAPPAAVPGRV